MKQIKTKEQQLDTYLKWLFSGEQLEQELKEDLEYKECQVFDLLNCILQNFEYQNKMIYNLCNIDFEKGTFTFSTHRELSKFEETFGEAKEGQEKAYNNFITSYCQRNKCVKYDSDYVENGMGQKHTFRFENIWKFGD